MSFNMSSYNGVKCRGVDYSKSLEAMLPDLIGKKPMSKIDISLKTGRCHQTITTLFNRLHADKKIHIAGWRRGTSGPIFPVWILGPGVDARKPKPLTSKEKCARYRDGGKAKATRRTEKTIKKLAAGLKHVDPLMSAIYGVA